jgi:TRAP-type C4-dicarboxylate transport system substrate-binding protein
MIGYCRVLVLSILLGAVAVVAGCGGSGFDRAGGKPASKPVVLTLANPEGDTEEIDGLVSAVSRLSNGRMRIDVHNRWRYGQVWYENGLIGDVRAGRAELGIAGSRAWDSVGVTSFQALNAPLLIDSYDLQQRVLSGPLVAPMLNGLRPLGLVGLGVLPGPLSYPFGAAHPLLKPADYAGLTFGLQQSRVAAQTLRALGAKPVAFAAEGSIAGFGGFEQGTAATAGNSYHRHGLVVTSNVVLWPRPLVVFANQTAFAKLTPAEQGILGRAASDAARQTNSETTSHRFGNAVLCNSGRVRYREASLADVRALRRTVQPVYAALKRDSLTRRLIAQISTIRRGISAEPTLRCIRSGLPGVHPGPLDGVYQFSASAADLTAAGADPSELVPENEGRMTFVFDRGRFAFTQENGQACTWGYGKLTVTPGKLEQLFTDGGGIAPTGATNKPGEQFEFRWSLYRDQLTLMFLPGYGGPTADVAKSWRRISSSPTTRYFARRCPPPAAALPR